MTGPPTGLDALGQRPHQPRIGRGIRVGEDKRGRLDFGDGGGRIGPAGLDDRKGAGLAEHIEQIGRRILGDHDHRTQERHEDGPVAGSGPQT